MECKLDRETEAHHISESGWKESARQQSVKNISYFLEIIGVAVSGFRTDLLDGKP